MTAPSGAGNLPLPRWAYVPGNSDKSSADYETLAQITVLVPPRFGGYVPARHPALRYGITLNDHGYFWEAPGDPGGGVGGGAAGRPRTDSVARLHPDRDREFTAAHAEAPRHDAAARGGAR